MPGTLPLRRFDLVICDIDGCLAPESSTLFDLPALAAVRDYARAARERGDRPALTLCSGRPQPFAEAICRLIDAMDVPSVCENGAWLYHPATNRYELDPAITDAHLAAVADASAWSRQTWGPRGVTLQPGKAASVTLYHPDAGFLRDTVFPAVRDEFDRRAWPFRVTMTWFYINCDLTHVSKGSGIDRLLRAHPVPRARLAGIGDTPGDRCIADRVGFFACPANAQAAIKEHAHYIAPRPEAHGVLDILDRLVE